MQYQHHANVDYEGAEVVDATATKETEKWEAPTDFSLEASLARIDALAESLSNRGGGKRTAETASPRAKKRPSIGSDACSLAIEELASIDSTFLASSLDGFSSGVSRLSLGTDNGEENSTTRFSNGMWSLQDMESWVCGICTYENEPVFLSCDMCGQTKQCGARLQHEQQERTLMLQEQRLQEIQVVCEPASRRRTPTRRSNSNSSTTIPSSPTRRSNNSTTIPSAAAMEDHSIANIFEFSGLVLKPPGLKLEGQDSVATERTWDMDQSDFTHMGNSSMMGSSMMGASGNMGNQSFMGQSSRQWQSSRRSAGSTKIKAIARQRFLGLDEISDEVSV